MPISAPVAGKTYHRAAVLAACVLALSGCAATRQAALVTAPQPVPIAAAASGRVAPQRLSPASYSHVAYQGSEGLLAMNAAAAYHAGYTGAGVRIAIIDSGIAPTAPAFAGRIEAASHDVAGQRSITDVAGHGTPIAAIAAGAATGSADRTMGVAFGSSLLVLRSDTPGSCATAEGCAHRDSDIARGIDRALESGARIINLSLTGDEIDPVLTAAIARATARDVIVVLAAGNEGAERPGAFALIADDEAIARGRVIIVGSHDRQGRKSTFSNAAGPSRRYILAMGDEVRSFDHRGQIWFYSGTSYAAPQVAGAAALLAEAFPQMSGREIVDRLLTTAVDMGEPGVDSVHGHGRLDLGRAIAAPVPMRFAGTGNGRTTRLN